MHRIPSRVRTECRAKGGRLVRSGDQEAHVPCRRERGGGEGQTRDERRLRGAPNGHRCSPALARRRSAGEKRGGVAVGTESEEHHVETGSIAPDRADQARVPGGLTRRGPDLAAQPMHPTRRHGYPGQKRRSGRPEVAVGIPRGDAAFVGEVDVGGLPRKTSTDRPGEPSVEPSRGMSSRHDQREAPAIPNGGPRVRDHPPRERVARGVEVRKRDDPRCYSTYHRYPHSRTRRSASAGPQEPAG